MLELAFYLVQALEDDKGLFPADSPFAGAQHGDGLAQDGYLVGEVQRHRRIEHAFASGCNTGPSPAIGVMLLSWGGTSPCL